MKKLLALLLVAGGIGAAIGFYFYNKPVEGLDNKASDYTVSATDLYQSFETDEGSANRQYLDKIIQVKGLIKTVRNSGDGSDAVVLESGNPLGGVICQMAGEAPGLEAGNEVVIKGMCTGMLMDVVLVRCVIVE